MAGIADDPDQFAVVLAAYPVAGHRRILAGGLAQEAAQSIQPVLGNRRLPGALAAPFGELVEDAPGFDQRILAALGSYNFV